MTANLAPHDPRAVADIIDARVSRALRSDIFKIADLRRLAKNIGARVRGSTRESVRLTLDGVALHQIISQIGRIGALADKNEVRSINFTANERAMLRLIRAKDDIGVIQFLAGKAEKSRATGYKLRISDIMTVSELGDLYHKIDNAVYGDRILTCDIRIVYPAPLNMQDFRNVPIRTKAKPLPTPLEFEQWKLRAGKDNFNLKSDSDSKFEMPTYSEARESVAFSGIDLNDASGYRVKPETIAVSSVNDVIPVLRNFDWSRRAHFGSVLKYMSMSKTFEGEQKSSFLDDMEEKKLCCYDVAQRDLDLTKDEIEGYLEKKAADGMTCDDMLRLYGRANVALYCFNLNEDVIKLSDGRAYYHAPPNDKRDQESEHKRVFVYIYANGHIYTPNKETRDILVRKRPEHTADEEVTKSKRKEREDDIIFVDSFEEAHSMAVSIQAMHHENSGSVPHQELEDGLKRLDDEMKALKGKYSREARARRDAIKLEKKLLKDELIPKITAGSAYTEARHNTKIYVKQESIGEEYMNLILNNGEVYASDINIARRATQMKYTHGITLYANCDYERLKKTADELGVKYTNQNLPALARKAFKQHRDREGSQGWEKSTLSVAVSQLAAMYPAQELQCTYETKMNKESHIIASIDCYRNYTSIARDGGFYTIPLLSDVEPYDGHQIGKRAYVYYVETDEAILFGGNGLYDFQVVAYGKSIGLIGDANIKLQIPCVASKKIDMTLHSYINEVYARVTDDSQRKQLINAFIGSMAIMHKHTKRSTVIVDNHEEACYYYNIAQTTHKGIMKIGDKRAGDKLEAYMVCASDIIGKSQTDEFIRRAIVQRGRMRAHILMCEIKETCPIVQIKTDAVYFVKERDAPHPRVERVTAKGHHTFGDRRREILDSDVRTKEEWQENAPYKCIARYEMTAQKWNKKPCGRISENDDFKAERLLHLRRAFIQGFPGSGKSHLLREFKTLLESQGKRVEVCAYTHAAALQIGGVTAHKMFGISQYGVQSVSRVKHMTRNVDYILIDEMSMIPASIYTVLSLLPDHVCVFGFGDFRQLAPVEGLHNEKRKYFDTTMFKSLFGYNLVTLRKGHRHDMDYVRQCIKFYDASVLVGVKEAIAHELLPDGIERADENTRIPLKNICHTNEKRIKVNEKVIERECNENGVSTRIYKGYDRKPGRVYTHETFNARKACYLVEHHEEYKHIFVSSREEENHESILDMLMRYIANSQIGEDGIGRVEVECYKSGHENRGRYQPTKSMSLYTMARPIRRILSEEYYEDIDCVNCHPMILHQLCAQIGIPTPRLTEYVTRREEVFAELNKTLGIDKDTAKVVMLALTNGGRAKFKKYEGWKSKWLCQYAYEIEDIHSAFYDKFKDQVKEFKESRRKKDKWEGSDAGAFMNMFLLERESEILEVIVREFKNRGLLGVNGDDLVRCADGLMVKKSAEITRALLDEIETAIKRDTGFEMKLVIKPMTPMVLPNDLPAPKKTAAMDKLYMARLWDECPKIKVGMPMIANDTNMSRGYTNNQTFNIEVLSHSAGIGLRSEDGDVVFVTEAQLRKDFRPNYCTTAHKAQGATISEKYGIHELERMEPEGAYVALTRASDVKNIILF